MSDEKAKILKIKDVFDLKLSIPDYQRPYKWTVKNVQQLVDDLLAHFRDSKVYRIGTIVLYKNGGKSEIVDGQQRLTTLSLLLHKLGRKDILFLQEKLSHSISKFNIMENYKFINGYNFPSGFEEYILKTCEMVRIELDDLDEAFQFFDSQNARGKPLESYDLLKAYHLREMRNKPDQIIHQCVECWERAAMSDDINNLNKIINSILFRLRRWHYQEHAEVFSANELDTFKGVSENVEYPYLNGVLATNAIQKMSAENPFLYRSISLFQSNQILINGKYFFDYIQHYILIYEKLFREKVGLLSLFNKINGVSLEGGLISFLDNYDYSYRVGDKYLRNLFECTLLFYFDKFGDNKFFDFVPKAFLWVYRLRFECQRISFKTVEDAAHDRDGLIYCIEKSIMPAQVMRFIPKLNEIKFDNVDEKIKEIFGVKYE
ncbi:MAG: DUF262 domain-containing protein [Aggregatibacter segnis]|jgi:hypothetical protein|uniref:DUF262 domain-containing protein n=1 Tax=Aggregatibacter segnis TaxID=739 RepID=UPI003FA0B650